MKCLLCGKTTPLLFEGKWCEVCFNNRETPAVREIESEADRKAKISYEEYGWEPAPRKNTVIMIGTAVIGCVVWAIGIYVVVEYWDVIVRMLGL